MPLFNRDRDINLFNSINYELLKCIVDTYAYLYKLKHEEMETNIYGESDSKLFEVGVKVFALITHEDQAGEYEDIGHDLNQSVTFAFHRIDLNAKNIYPQVGDYIEYNNSWFEIDEVVENQLVGGQTDQLRNFSIRCKSHMVTRDSITIEDVRPGFDKNTHLI